MTVTVRGWLRGTKKELGSGLEAELLMLKVLGGEERRRGRYFPGGGSGEERSWLVLQEERALTGVELGRLEELCARRKRGEPLAYILGEKEFYGRKFVVTPEVLIPRPETEEMVDFAIDILRNLWYNRGIGSISVLEVGTGSGCVAVSLALEGADLVKGRGAGDEGASGRDFGTQAENRNFGEDFDSVKSLRVVATDISEGALVVARENARRWGAEVEFWRGDLLERLVRVDDADDLSGADGARSFGRAGDLGGDSLPESDFLKKDGGLPDLIVANLPYVDRSWTWLSPELKYEPAGALFAEEGGLAVIRRLIRQVVERDFGVERDERGWQTQVLLEADEGQHEEIIKYAEGEGLKYMGRRGLILRFQG